MLSGTAASNEPLALTASEAYLAWASQQSAETGHFALTRSVPALSMIELEKD
jgi:hypothetical protein